MPSLSAKLFSSQNFSNIHSEKNHSCPKKRFLTFFLNAVRSPYLKGPMWNPSPQTLFLPLEFVCLSNSITHSFQIGPVNKTSSLSVRRQSISAKFASWYPLALVSSRTTSRPNSSREMKHDMYVLDCVHERIRICYTFLFLLCFKAVQSLLSYTRSWSHPRQAGKPSFLLFS